MQAKQSLYFRKTVNLLNNYIIMRNKLLVLGILLSIAIVQAQLTVEIGKPILRVAVNDQDIINIGGPRKPPPGFKQKMAKEKLRIQNQMRAEQKKKADETKKKAIQEKKKIQQEKKQVEQDKRKVEEEKQRLVEEEKQIEKERKEEEEQRKKLVVEERKVEAMKKQVQEEKDAAYLRQYKQKRQQIKEKERLAESTASLNKIEDNSPIINPTVNLKQSDELKIDETAEDQQTSQVENQEEVRQILAELEKQEPTSQQQKSETDISQDELAMIVKQVLKIHDKKYGSHTQIEVNQEEQISEIDQLMDTIDQTPKDSAEDKQYERLAKYIKYMPAQQKRHLRAMATERTQN